MSAAPPPSGSNNWSWKRIAAVGGLGSLGYFGLRFVVSFMAATAAAGETFEHDEVFDIEGDTVRTMTYEVLGDHAKLTYATSDATGPFSLYLIPSEDDGRFLDGEAFRFVSGHSHLDVMEASGSVVLPKGEYSFAVGCGALDGCRVPLHVEIEHWTSAPAPPLGTAVYVANAPVAIWDHEPFSIAAGFALEEGEFYTLAPGDLTIGASSDAPMNVCLFDADDVVVLCEDGVTSMQRTIFVDTGDYLLDVVCAAPGGRCTGELHVVFAPLK